VKLWIPTKDEPVDVTDVMGYLRDLARDYQLGAISYDPRFFDVPAKMLYDSGLPMVEVPQTVERMTPIVGDLYELVRTRGVTVDDDRGFEQQVLNAIARLNERGFTLAKGKSRGRIDAAIAFALAVDRIRHREKPRPKLFVRTT
jgi:phage terminase large subunit-like protein